MPAESDIAEPIPQRPWREDVQRMDTMTTLLGHNGMMMDKIMKQNRIHRMTMRAHARGSATVDPKQDDDPEDEMGVNIGNEIHNHYVPDPQPTPAASAPPAAGPSLWSRVLPYVGTGLVGAAVAYGATRTPAPTPQPSNGAVDTDTRLQPTVEVHD